MSSTQVLESLVGAPANSLNASQYHAGAPLACDGVRRQPACSDGDAAEAQLQLLRAAVLAEGGLLPTAIAIAAERGRAELDPADLIDAASRVAAGPVTEARLAAAAATMAALLTESRAYDDSPRRQALVGRVTALISELKCARWPQRITVGGQRIARLVEALSHLPGDRCETSTRTPMY